MIEKRTPDHTTIGRRLRLSTREIAVSVVLTLAALIAMAAFSYTSIDDETAMTRPVSPEAEIGRRQ